MSLLIRSRQSVEKARWGLCRQTVVAKAAVKVPAHYLWRYRRCGHPRRWNLSRFTIHVADAHAAALRWSWPLSPVTPYTTAQAVEGTSSSDLAAVLSVQPQRVETHQQRRDIAQLIFIYDSCSKQTATITPLLLLTTAFLDILGGQFVEYRL